MALVMGMPMIGLDTGAGDPIFTYRLGELVSANTNASTLLGRPAILGFGHNARPAAMNDSEMVAPSKRAAVRLQSRSST